MSVISSGSVDLRDSIKRLIRAALEHAVEAGDLDLPAIPDVVINRNKDSAHGDFASPVAMALAKLARRKPRDIAEIIVRHLPVNDAISQVEIAGPGFINVFLAKQAFHALVREIRSRDTQFGRAERRPDDTVQVEFVSANPTGPLHVGHGRGAAYGDAVAALLDAAGFAVQREYYVNDAGRQMDILATSVWFRYLELAGVEVAFPANGY